MELPISHLIVTQLATIERTLATLPRTAEHASFYKKQAHDTQIADLLTLATSMELTVHPDDAKDLLDAPEHGITPQHLRLLKNCITVIKYAKSMREYAFTTAVLQHENKLLADGFSDFWEEGKVRAPHETPNYHHDGLRTRTTHPAYQLWTDLRQLLSYPDEHIHPLLLTGITVYHLATSYPFLQFTLQTALLSAYSIIKPSRYSVWGSVSVITACWKTLQRTDFTFDPAPAHFTQFVEKMLKEVDSQLSTIHDTLAHQSSIAPQIRASLNDRQLKVLTYFKQHKKLNRKKYASMMNVAIATAFRDLDDLNKKGLIKAIGKGRGTAYVLAQLPDVERLQSTDESPSFREASNEIKGLPISA